jgi:curli biogenesis system outer membrane secretion channel CsgG
MPRSRPNSRRGSGRSGGAARRALLAGALAVATVALTGCQPVDSPLFDADAIAATRSVIVLPMVDAPGAEGAGSGKVVPGVLVAELVRMGRFNVIHVPPEKFEQALARSGYSASDCYDPAVSAALGRELAADAVVCGEITHYGTQKEHSSTAVLVVASGGTQTTHWVSLNLRMVKAGEGRIIYVGSGTASSKEGYTAAVKLAAQRATQSLRRLITRLKK